MKNVCVISAKACKESASRLAELLKAKFSLVDKVDFSNYKWVINYGSSVPIICQNVINSPQRVKLCVNKLSTFKRLEGLCSVVSYTQDPNEAKDWLVSDGCVVSRATATGKQGDGMKIPESLEEFNNTPATFWTRYFHHTNEVRINVYKNTIVSVFDKRRNGDVWDFVPLEIVGEHPEVSKMIKAIHSKIGIDMYGMDVLVNGNEVRLLEINSGAILHPETEDRLVSLIKEDLNGTD